MLMVIGALAVMFAMGIFTPKPASAALGGIDVAVTPTTAKATGQYTITVTGSSSAGITAIPVGGTITVTFGSKFTVPSSIAASAIKLKASVVSNSGTANRLNSVGDVSVDGRAVTITVPDMDSATSTGDNGIAASTGTGANFIITFTQAAGIVNPSTAQAADSTTASKTLTVKTSADTTAVTAATFTAITSFTKFTPSTAARGATLTVTGGGFAATCADCKIRLNPQNSVAPTTGAGGVAFNGSGSIDSTGVFEGTVILGSGTKAGGYVWVEDKTGTDVVSTTAFVQKAGATPRSTSSKPGSTVTVDLVDFTADDSIDGSDDVTIGGVAAEDATSPGITAIPSTGSTTTLVPFKFKVPASIGEGVHKVNIDLAGKDANFDLTIGLRSITVTPATAVPGQSITLSGTGYDTSSGTIAAGALTMKAGTVATQASVNGSAITIDNTGAWSYATTFPYYETTSGSGVSNTIVFTATDSDSLVGVSDSSFARTTKSVTLSPTTISPGGALQVTVAGFTADNGTVSGQDAEFTVTMATAQTGGTAITLTGTSTFPIGSDGTGVGTVTIPTSGTGVTAGTKYITVTDNYTTIGVTAAGTRNGADSPSTNNSKQVSVSIPKGTVTVTPLSASTGNTVTITGAGFPPGTTASALTIGGADAMPSGGIITDAAGSYTQVVEVPAATTGGSLTPGTQIIETTVGAITGSSTEFSTPNPTIIISPAEAAVEETITITGEGFNSLGTVTTLNIGSASALPSPAPRATRNGEITATVTVPLLNAGSYTVTMANASAFSASATFTATAAKAVVASTADNTEVIFADVIANDDNLVRVWRFSNADQSWAFFDPRPAFAAANTLAKTGAGDIVWVNVTAEEAFQGGTLFPGWNLISLK
jgi:hypothetical protein